MLISLFQTLEFWSFLPNIGILVLSFETLELLSYSSKLWNSGPIVIEIGIVIISFQTLELRLYAFKRWNSDLILASF